MQSAKDWPAHPRWIEQHLSPLLKKKCGAQPAEQILSLLSFPHNLGSAYEAWQCNSKLKHGFPKGLHELITSTGIFSMYQPVGWRIPDQYFHGRGGLINTVLQPYVVAPNPFSYNNTPYLYISAVTLPPHGMPRLVQGENFTPDYPFELAQALLKEQDYIVGGHWPAWIQAAE